MQNVAAIIVGFLVLGYVLLGVSDFSPTPISGNDDILIGFIGPLSGDGAAWGEIERNSIQLEVDKINAKGGINGRHIKLIVEDGRCEGAAAVSAAHKLIDSDGVRILLVSCSQEVLPIAPIADAEKVLQLASYSSASSISKAGDYTFRNSWLNKDMANGMASEVIIHAKKSAIISEESEFAQDLKNLFVAQYQELGGAVLSMQDFPQGSKDVRTQITKILAAKPEVVVVNPNSPATGLAVLKQLKEQGYKGVVVGNFFGSSVEVQAAPEAKGMIYVADPSVISTPEKERFFAEYKERFGTTPSLEWPAVARYDAVHILEQAIRAVGDDPTVIKNYLYDLKSFTGLIGTYGFDSNGDVVGIKPTVAVIK
ncbi:MAG: ABC transporter substrate-binding protein [Patescibacteria group bacterium]